MEEKEWRETEKSQTKTIYLGENVVKMITLEQGFSIPEIYKSF